MNWLVDRSMQKNDIILDIGCVDGGRAAVYQDTYLKLFGENGNVIGIDISKENLDRRVTLYSPDIYCYRKLNFAQCDWDNFPFKKDSIDLIVYDNGMEHSKNITRTLDELHRSCKREIILGVPHAPDLAVRQGLHGHMTEFTHLDFGNLISSKFYVLESYHLKHGYGGYDYIIVRATKNVDNVIAKWS